LGNCTNPRADYEIQLVGAGSTVDDSLRKLKISV
jgi:hypothetical protein